MDKFLLRITIECLFFEVKKENPNKNNNNKKKITPKKRKFCSLIMKIETRYFHFTVQDFDQGKTN